MFVEPDPRYRDPYEVDDDTELAGEVVLLEDGEGALLAHSLGPALPGAPLLRRRGPAHRLPGP